MTFAGMIAILTSYFAAVIVAMFLWKPRPPEPPHDGGPKAEKVSFKEYHRRQMAKPIAREAEPSVYGQKKQA